MKIGVYCTNNLIYPVPKQAIYANMTIAGTVADELSNLGHDVTFFAPEGTITKARLKTFDMLPFSSPKIYTKYNHPTASYHYEDLMLAQAFRYMQENGFDIFHSHARPFSILNYAPIQMKLPVLATIHDPITDDAYKILHEYNRFDNLYLASLTYSQRTPRPKVKWVGNAYNGTNTSHWQFNNHPDSYLLTVGRIMPNKGVDIAVRIALKSGRKLKIVGSYYPGDEHYFNNKIKPFLGKQIEYLGQQSKKDLIKLYSNAYAFLMPLRWEEPFGLVMIEAMASGTPVIATNRGSVPEIIKDGVTGFIAKNNSTSTWLRLLNKIDTIKRNDCRKYAERKFSTKTMAKNYLKLYEKILRMQH